MRRLAQAEGGFAMVVVIGMLFIGLLLGVAAFEGVQPGIASAVRDQHSRRALQAALGGAEIARRRLNELMPDVGALLGGIQGNVCITTTPDLVTGTPTLSEVTVALGSWCPAVSIDLGTGTTATYQVSAPTVTVVTSSLLQATKLLQRKIVAIGSADGVRRRVLITLDANGTLNKLTSALISGGSLAPYQTVQGSFRECRSAAVSSSAPDADC
jgi:hypothetical protein